MSKPPVELRPFLIGETLERFPAGDSERRPRLASLCGGAIDAPEATSSRCSAIQPVMPMIRSPALCVAVYVKTGMAISPRDPDAATEAGMPKSLRRWGVLRDGRKPPFLALAIEAEWRERAAGVIPPKPKARPEGQRHQALGKGNAYAPVGRASNGAAKRMSADTPTNRPPMMQKILPPDFRWNSLARDAVNERVARDGGEDQRHDQAQDRLAQLTSELP
jgi:hypothetical protein